MPQRSCLSSETFSLQGFKDGARCQIRTGMAARSTDFKSVVESELFFFNTLLNKDF